MAVVNFSDNLGLALPTTGDLVGIWGETINDAITMLLDDAITGTLVLNADADVVLSNTVAVRNQARNAMIRWAASNTVERVITAPATSKHYTVMNFGTGPVRIRGANVSEGVVVGPGVGVTVAWSGVDYIPITPAVNITQVPVVPTEVAPLDPKDPMGGRSNDSIVYAIVFGL